MDMNGCLRYILHNDLGTGVVRVEPDLSWVNAAPTLLVRSILHDVNNHGGTNFVGEAFESSLLYRTNFVGRL